MFTSRALVLAAGLGFFVSCSSTQELSTNKNHSNTNNDGAAELRQEPTEDWHHLDAGSETFPGIEADRAYRELLSGLEPKRKVVVAILDSGTDIHHEDLDDVIWTNTDEIPGDGIDNDKNGYVDDVHGWNFIGGADGGNVNKDTYEATRLYKKLGVYFESKDTLQLNDADQEKFELYKEVRTYVNNELRKANEALTQLETIKEALKAAKEFLSIESLEDVDPEDVKVEAGDDAFTQQSKQVIGFFLDNGFTEEDLNGEYDYFNDRVNYYFNTDFNPRSVIGDDYDDLSFRFYGNADVVGPRTDHGTHVAGIVGAERNNGLGIDGIADNVELMILRVVPDGDEHDKDVANAIRYAAENGAHVLNMSFGKGYSPQKEYVDAAIRYADEKGVLLIHSAGNGGANIDSTDSFPTKFYEDGGAARNFITVGASSFRQDSTLAAPFSNYGMEVDLFAPGVRIYSTYPDNEYEYADGTSMAGPVVTGAAALLMSYFPELSAQDVKQILMSSVSTFPQLTVYQPGDGEPVPFSGLSRSGGILNVYQAIQAAKTKVSGTN